MVTIDIIISLSNIISTIDIIISLSLYHYHYIIISEALATRAPGRFGKESRESYIQIHVHRKLHGHVAKMSDEEPLSGIRGADRVVMFFWVEMIGIMMND